MRVLLSSSEGAPQGNAGWGGTHSRLVENEQTAGDTPRQDRIIVPALVGAGRRDGEGLETVEGDGI